MPNTIVLKLKENTRVTRKDILDALEDQYDNLKEVQIISQIFDNKTWYIKFKDKYNVQEIINKSLSVASQDLLIQDANNFIK